jgi:imidazolonepropionase-like amidohydrolase
LRTLATLAVFALAAPAAAETIYIHAGRMLDVPGRAPRGPSTIVVTDGRVAQVRDGHAAPEAGARLVDLRDRFVLPGLIDSHVHLSSDRAGNEGLLAGFTESAQLTAYETLWNARKTLRAGFTTVRNLGDEGAVLALREAIARGWVEGPRIIDAGQSISTTAGHMDARLGVRDELHDAIPYENLCDGVEECRKAVRRQIGRGDEAKAIIDTAHMAGKKVAVHAHGADGVLLALKAGADSIEHGTLMDDETIRLFAKSRAYYVPTLSTVNGYLERIAKDPNAYPPEVRAKIDYRISITGKALEKAVPAGVKVAFGTDAGVSKHGRNADEFELMVKHGMTPATAIQAATINAADLLGLSKEIGTLEPGKRADIIAVSGDPLQDVTVLKQVGFVMKDGKIVRD